MKTLICQVKNSFEYLPLFLAHNEKIFDEIHIIDQCSNKDLRDLNNKKKGIYFYKTGYSFFNAMIGINVILEYKNIRKRSGFTFILDIDEFLPFDNKEDFENFLLSHENCDAISFQWKNGLNFSTPEKTKLHLDSKSDLRFFKDTSSTRKLAYNAKKTQFFLPYHGNHNAKFHFFKFAGCKKKAFINKSDVPLLHVPFSSTENLLEKVNSFSQDEFLDKIINRHKKSKEIFQRATNGTVTESDLCFFSANYRTLGREKIVQADADDFDKTTLFSSIQNRITFWAEQLHLCGDITQHPDIELHEDIARKILGEKTIGGRYFFYQAIKKHTFIDIENVIHLKK
jgi:hypothetical protein